MIAFRTDNTLKKSEPINPTFKVGDTIYIHCSSGRKEFTITSFEYAQEFDGNRYRITNKEGQSTSMRDCYFFR